MLERNKYKLNKTIHIEPQDQLVVSVQDKTTMTQDIFRENIDCKLDVDTIVTFDLNKPILGLSSGVGAIFGKAIK